MAQQSFRRNEFKLHGEERMSPSSHRGSEAKSNLDYPAWRDNIDRVTTTIEAEDGGLWDVEITNFDITESKALLVRLRNKADNLRQQLNQAQQETVEQYQNRRGHSRYVHQHSDVDALPFSNAEYIIREIRSNSDQISATEEHIRMMELRSIATEAKADFESKQNLEGGKRKKMRQMRKKPRKHKGINQQTGRLKKGYKYSGKLKSGLSKIVKMRSKK